MQILIHASTIEQRCNRVTVLYCRAGLFESKLELYMQFLSWTVGSPIAESYMGNCRWFYSSTDFNLNTNSSTLLHCKQASSLHKIKAYTHPWKPQAK